MTDESWRASWCLVCGRTSDGRWVEFGVHVSATDRQYAAIAAQHGLPVTPTTQALPTTSQRLVSASVVDLAVLIPATQPSLPR